VYVATRAALPGLLPLLLERMVMKPGLELLLTAKSAPSVPDSASNVTESARAENTEAIMSALASAANVMILLTGSFNDSLLHLSNVEEWKML
jgi:hypothetical protein